MKKRIIIYTAIFILLILFVFTNFSIAATFSTGKIRSDNDLGNAGTQITNIGSTILTVVSNVGIVLSVVMLAIIGVKYMISSADERAEYKKNIMPYLIGAFLVFSASTVAKIVKTIGEKL